jgi:hypothetical protein
MEAHMSEDLIPVGSYMARGTSLVERGSGTGNKGAVVEFAITEGPQEGRTIEWTGWLGEKTRERTAESLAICGYDGTDPRTVSKNLVQIVIDHETNVSEKNGKTYVNARVKWVNDPARSRAQFEPTDGQALAGLRGLVLQKHAERAKTALSERDPLGEEAARRAKQAPNAPDFKAKF